MLWDRWDEVDALLERALELPEGERSAFLDAECKDDAPLREQLESLLRATGDGREDRLSGRLLRAALDGASEGGPVLPPPPSDLLGASVGPYRLEKVVGVGGMGAVYLAARADGAFERDVAVKVLHATPGARVDLTERFRVERQILASLVHSGIAQLLDGGVMEDGRPYLVMEYVDGAPIDVHCSDGRLDLDARIRLIVEVAKTVEFAHRHMVVHRDLKPNNVLVTSEGGVKLLDFGIAKLLDPTTVATSTDVTEAGFRFATPGYAAPEQLLGEPVSTQTDVYALSAVLYELLCGEVPYSRRPSDSVLERVVEGLEPTAPSAVAASRVPRPAGDALEGTAPDLEKSLIGDLDAILLKGLRARPEERYGSVTELREDLERYLSGRPVRARDGALLYKARKFARRNLFSVVAAGAVFFLVTGSAVGLALQRSAVVAERNRAEEAALLAAQEAETAGQVTEFLVELFQGSDPLAQGGDTVTVRGLLEQGADRVSSELAGQPAVQARLLGVLGQVHMNLGSYEEGLRLLDQAVAMRLDSIEADPGVPTAQLVLANAYLRAREFREAREAFASAIAAATEWGQDSVLARSHMGLGEVYAMTERVDSAEVAYQTASLLYDQWEAPEEERWDALTRWAGLLRRRGDLEGAESLYRRVVESRRSDVAGSVVDLAVGLNNLAIVLRMQGDYEGAALHYRESLDTLSAVLGAGHPTSLMIAGNLARTLHESGRGEEAVETYRRRVAAAREQWPEGHWQLGGALMNLGAELVLLDRPSEAVTPLAEALDVMVEQVGAFHSWTNVYRIWLGTAEAMIGRTDAAKVRFAEAYAGLSSYEGLATDFQVIGMLRPLVGFMDDKGLTGEAARFRALIPADSG